jgi:hypothetical protein
MSTSEFLLVIKSKTSTARIINMPFHLTKAISKNTIKAGHPRKTPKKALYIKDNTDFILIIILG